MLLVNPLSPGGKTCVKETYLPTQQSVQDVAPVDAEYLPAAQSVHVTVPVTVLCFPAAHAEHVPPSGPEYQVLQTQLCTPVLAMGEFGSEGHV
jgi:hypothetical protein